MDDAIKEYTDTIKHLLASKWIVLDHEDRRHMEHLIKGLFKQFFTAQEAVEYIQCMTSDMDEETALERMKDIRAMVKDRNRRLGISTLIAV